MYGVFFALESVQRATGELFFEAIDKHFQGSATFSYSNLIGLGTDGANVMLGQRNCSVMVAIKTA